MSRQIRAIGRGKTRSEDWLTVIQLPGYAPDLNPVEGAWSSMKSAPAVRPQTAVHPAVAAV